MTADDPIYSAIEAHRKAYAGYDAAVAANASTNEKKAAFRALDRGCRRLVKAETSTMAGLIALLRYMAPLLQEDDAPRCRWRSSSTAGGRQPSAPSSHLPRQRRKTPDDIVGGQR
jgi:hypothetical protein